MRAELERNIEEQLEAADRRNKERLKLGKPALELHTHVEVHDPHYPRKKKVIHSMYSRSFVCAICNLV